MSPTRRDLLKAAPLAVPLLAGSATAQEAPKKRESFPGFTVRMHEPRNLETPVQHLGSANTPTSQFYVRSHFAVPKLDAKSWTLKVGGHVEKPRDFSLDDLKALPTVEKSLLLECAGNGRIFLVPQVRGLQWAFGGVGQAAWTGIPIAAILDLVRPKAGAVEVLLTGADKGPVNSDPPSPGPVAFDRSIPLAKAKRPECLLAWGMNGAELTPAHGYPLRAVVGGYYGMASIKWLTELTVLDRPYDGFWQTFDYSYYERIDGKPTLVPVDRVQPKAIISNLGSGSIVPPKAEVRIEGLAWAGDEVVKSVEFSSDGGRTWSAAKFEKSKPHEWVAWSYDWLTAETGSFALVARCTSGANVVQPDKRDPDRRTYMINHTIPIDVTVA